MEASTGRTKAKFRVLYLGSDLELIRALKKQETAADYHLVTCSDAGTATIFLASEIPYRLLLIDFDWRAGDGLQLAQLAHSLRHRKRMSIMLIAGKRMTTEQKALARKAGVKEFARKDTVNEIVRHLQEDQSGRVGRG